MFIFTIPSDGQKYAPVYCRLQNKLDNQVEDVVKEFTEVKSMGYIGKSNQDIIICAPKTHVQVELNKLVVIATIPNADKTNAPVYFKRKVYTVPIKKEHREAVIEDIDFSECCCGLVEDHQSHPESN